jgi:hypothetical protein
MNLFQALTLSLLSTALLAEIVGLARKPAGKKLRLVRAAVWMVAAVAIAHPQFLQTVANGIGIGRGADLVLYLFVLAFLASGFYFYSRYLRLQGQLTDVVRHLAIENARHGRQNDAPIIPSDRLSSPRV